MLTEPMKKTVERLNKEHAQRRNQTITRIVKECGLTKAKAEKAYQIARGE